LLNIIFNLQRLIANSKLAQLSVSQLRHFHTKTQLNKVNVFVFLFQDLIGIVILFVQRKDEASLTKESKNEEPVVKKWILELNDEHVKEVCYFYIHI